MHYSFKMRSLIAINTLLNKIFNLNRSSFLGVGQALLVLRVGEFYFLRIESR